jgi:hypothetical protein
VTQVRFHGGPLDGRSIEWAATLASDFMLVLQGRGQYVPWEHVVSGRITTTMPEGVAFTPGVTGATDLVWKPNA